MIRTGLLLCPFLVGDIMNHWKWGFPHGFLYGCALEVLRQLVVAIGSDLFLDSLAKTYEKMAPADCKAKGQKIYFHKI